MGLGSVLPEHRSQMLMFSIIIPCYNEGEDVRLAIESALGQKYKNKEILVVDDSDDDTPRIIEEYLDGGVQLIRGPDKGCCAARNVGMKSARGDVVVLLNADVVLPADFLDKILVHYEAGADYVLVEQTIFNLERPLARFSELERRAQWQNLGSLMEWTEGFSCRRQAALEVGLIPGDFSVRFCRDWFFGKKLSEGGFRKVIDRSIVVTDKTPETLGGFWHVRVARGRFAVLSQGCLWRYSVAFLLFKICAKDIVRIAEVLSVLPAAWRICRIAGHSQKPLKDLAAAAYGYLVQSLGYAVGEWRGMRLLIAQQLP